MLHIVWSMEKIFGTPVLFLTDFILAKDLDLIMVIKETGKVKRKENKLFNKCVIIFFKVMNSLSRILLIN